MLFPTAKKVTDRLIKEALKDILSGKKGVMKFYYDNSLWLTDGYMAVGFSSEKFPLKEDLIPEMECPEVYLTEFPEDSYEKATERCRKVHNAPVQGSTVMLCSDTHTAYANSRYLEEFKGCDYYISGENRPVRVYTCYGELVGIVLPIRVREKWM